MQGPPPVPSRLGPLPSLGPVPENNPHEDNANTEIITMIQAIFVFFIANSLLEEAMACLSGNDDSCLHSVHRENTSSLKLNSGVFQNLLLERLRCCQLDCLLLNSSAFLFLEVSLPGYSGLCFRDSNSFSKKIESACSWEIFPSSIAFLTIRTF